MANGNFGGGTGSAERPYIVEDAQDFFAISQNRGAYYLQGRDIDFSSITSWTNISNSANPFTGKYDGDNYSMTNISLQNATSVFGFCNRANIINLKLFGTLVVTNTPSNAPLATSSTSTSSYTVISNVHSDFIITRDPLFTTTANFIIGGLVSGSNFTISGSSSSGEITVNNSGGNTRIAGIVCYGGGQNSPSVSNSSNHCNIKSSGHAYGIIDYTDSSSKVVQNCYNTGDLSGTQVASIMYTGAPTRCYNSGILTSSSQLRGIGGSGSPSSSYCYNLAPYAQIASGSSPSLNNFYKISPNASTNNYVLDTMELRSEV